MKRRIFADTIFVRWWDENETCYALGKAYGRSLIVRTLSMMVFMLLLAGGSQQLAAQAFTNVTAIHVQSNIGGTLLQDGKVCFYPTDQNDLLVTVNDGLGGIVSPNSPACGAITSGVIAGGFQVANSALTNPAGIYYRIQITDLCGACLNRGKIIIDLRKVPNVTGATWSLDSYVPSGVIVPPSSLYFDMTEIAAPLNPNSGIERWFSSSVTHQLSCLTSAGGNCSPSGGGGMSNPMTTLGDLIYENATPAAARLAGNTTTTPQYLKSLGSGSAAVAPAWTQVAYGDLSGVPSTFAPSAHNLLSSAHGDTTAAAAVRGDGIYAIGATPTWQRLAHPATSGGYFKWNGTDIVASGGAAGGTGACSANQFETTDNPDAAPTCVQPAFTNLSGVLALAQTPLTTQGDILFANVTPALARLAANATATNKYLQSVSSGNPAWAQVGYGDLSGVPSTFVPAAHNLLSSAHGDTTAAAAVRGDGIYAIGATPTWQRLAHPATSGGYFKWNGTDIVASSGAAGGTGACSANQFETTDNGDAAPTCAQPAFTNLGGSATNAQLPDPFDVSAKGHTLPVKTGTIAGAPGSCTANKELYIETDATAGQQLFICNAAGNGWILVGDGGGGGGMTNPMTTTGDIIYASNTATPATPARLAIGGATTVLHGGATPSYAAVTSADTTGTFAPNAHTLLSASHGDTTAAAAVRGDGIFAIGATPTWQRLAHPSASGGYFKWNGTDIVASSGAAGGTGACSANQFETTDNGDAAPTCAQPAFTNLSGLLALGQTPLTTRGDLLTVNSTPGLARLPIGGANTLLHGGTDPSYSAVAQGDVSNGYTDLSSTQIVAGAKTLTGADFACNVNGVFYVGDACAAVWGGGDIGAQINTVYSGVCATQGGCTISVIPKADGTCYSYTTKISMTTIGEEVMLTSQVANSDNTGNVPGGACLNFTTTAGNAASSGTGAESGNTVTLTFGAVPSGLADGDIVNVTGCNVAGYLGFWRVLTHTSTTFTYSNPTSGLGAATTCTATISPAAITLDWTPAAGGGYETGSGIRNIFLTNGTTYTNGGGGNSTFGVRIGNTNSGAHAAHFETLKQAGFGVGYWNDNGLSWGQVFVDTSAAWSTNAWMFGTNLENISFVGGRCAVNSNCFISNNTAISVHDMSFDSNTVSSVNYINGPGAAIFQCFACHFEDLGSSNNHYIIGAGNIQLYGGDALDDTSSGVGDYMFDSVGGNFEVYGTQVNANRQFTQILRVNAGSVTRGHVAFFNQAPTLLTQMVGGTGCVNCISDTSLNGAGIYATTPWYIEAPLGPATSSRPNLSLQGFMVVPMAAPLLACSNSGGSLAAATHFFKYTFINASGETTVSPEASCATTGASGSVVVTAPVLPKNATGYTVYDSNTTNTELKQAASGACANITANCTVTVLAAGAAVPGSNTASSGPTSSSSNSDDIAIISSDGTINNNVELHTVASGVNGAVVLYQGTNTITDTSSGTITSYTVNRPLVAKSGVQFGVNASNVITQNFSGDTAHALSQTAKTAAVTTFTLCAATAGTACGQVGQYRISYNFWGSGTACSAVTAGSVGLNLTWTDENAVAHTTISVPMWDQKSAANGILFNFNTALGTEGASGSYIISTNGTIIQAATTYTACTTGTGTYNLRMSVEQLQ